MKFYYCCIVEVGVLLSHTRQCSRANSPTLTCYQELNYFTSNFFLRCYRGASSSALVELNSFFVCHSCLFFSVVKVSSTFNCRKLFKNLGGMLKCFFFSTLDLGILQPFLIFVFLQLCSLLSTPQHLSSTLHSLSSKLP